MLNGVQVTCGMVLMEKVFTGKIGVVSLGLFLVAEPPFEILFLAALLLLVDRFLALKHFFATLEKILGTKGQSTTLTGVLLDCGVVT
jgi:hypothetical protein